MPFACLTKEAVDKFRKALKGKELDVFKMMQMSTEERTALLGKYVGENAKIVNALFEEKLILKNQLQGIKNWAAKVGEIGRYDPLKKAKLDTLMSEFRAKQQERMFSPSEQQAFLADLVEQKLGTRITRTEAKTLFDLQAKADELKMKYDEKKASGQKWNSLMDRAQYGAQQVILRKYTDLLKNGDLSVKDMLKEFNMATKESWKINKVKTIGEVFNKVAKTLTDNSVAMVASFDNSFLGRQGLHTLMTEPGRFIQAKIKGVEYKNTWWNMARKSFVDIANTLGGKSAKEALMADYISRENYLSGDYETAGILPKFEEQFPTELPSRVKGMGRVYQASQDAFSNSAIRARIDLYDFYKKLAEKSGATWDKTQIKSVGTFVNALTARGALPKVFEAPIVKLVMWAPRMLKGNWDTLTGHSLGGGLDTKFTRQQAAINTAQIIATTAAIMYVANAIKPGSAETDPRSSDFGKIKIGNTKFDYTAGAGSLAVLASRFYNFALDKPAYKSTTTGVITKLNTGKYGSKTMFDVMVDFATGKTTPGAGAVVNWLKGKNFQGQKPTLANTAANSFTPIGIKNAIGLKDDHSATAVLGVLLDGLGINANTQQLGSTDWGESTGVELQQFHTKVGDEKFKKANDEFNKQVSEWVSGVRINPAFSTLSEEDKQKVITNKKSDLKDKIFKQYGFHYKQAKTKKLPKF